MYFSEGEIVLNICNLKVFLLKWIPISKRYSFTYEKFVLCYFVKYVRTELLFNIEILHPGFSHRLKKTK